MKTANFDKWIKRSAAFCALATALYVSSCTLAGNNSAGSSQTSTSSISERTDLFDGRVSFMPPKGLKQLTPAVMIAKFPDENELKYAFANDSDSAKISVYRVNGTELKQDELERIKRFVEGTHREYSGWLVSEIITINGRQWLHFEWKKPVIDDLALVAPPPIDGEPTPTPQDNRPIHYNEYTTSFDNSPLRFVFETLADDYPKVKDDFAKSAASIRIK